VYLMMILAFLLLMVVLSIYNGVTSYDKAIAFENHETTNIFFRGFFEELVKVFAIILLCRSASMGQRISFSICIGFSILISIYENYFIFKEILFYLYHSIVNSDLVVFQSILLFLEDIGYLGTFLLGWSQIARIFLHATLLIMSVILFKNRTYLLALVFPVIHGLNNASAGYIVDMFPQGHYQLYAEFALMNVVLLVTLLLIGSRYRNLLIKLLK
jgi:hypothetical protein